jgi:PPM family protein phosphatase
MTLTYAYASLSIRGARASQEDACAFAPPHAASIATLAGASHQGFTTESGLICVLADGMGGHAAGALASTTACRTFVSAYTQSTAAARQRLKDALDQANRAIQQASEADKALDGMGCTLVGIMFGPTGLGWVSVGDSPLYLFRDNRLYQLNQNHSLAPLLDALAAAGEMSLEEAAAHPRRHFLRSALTGQAIELVDLSEALLPLQKNDWVLVASDGIDTLSHAELADILAVNNEVDPESMAEVIIASIEDANETHQDNATVMAIRVG